MTARLVLLTGPAAAEVAAVFSDNCHCLCSEGDPHRTWDEVRDYLLAPLRVLQSYEKVNGGPIVAAEFDDCFARSMASAICGEPDGEAWLVGRVLPSKADINPDLKFPGGWADYITQAKRCCSTCGDKAPARLAILAPEPPPLLVERVRAWGGEVWECGIPDSYPCVIFVGERSAIGSLIGVTHRRDTWPEAVRAALGEVAP